MASGFKFKGSGGFRTAGLRGLRPELSSEQIKSIQVIPVEIFMHHGCALRFPIQTTHVGTLQKTFCLGYLWSNLPESA